jgi:DNA polymerase III alpha subunit (gram-positive type)
MYRYDTDMYKIYSSPEFLEASGKQHVQNAPQAFIDVDVEADGIAGYGSLLSIGAVSPWGEVFYTEIRPISDEYIPENKSFCELHGLERQQLLDTGQDPQKALIAFTDWTQAIVTKYTKQAPVLTAYNASFDFPLIDAYYKQFGLENPYGHAAFCIKSLALAITGHLAWDWKQTGKGRLPASLIPEGDFTHNALEDARYQQKIHFRLAGLIHID